MGLKLVFFSTALVIIAWLYSRPYSIKNEDPPVCNFDGEYCFNPDKLYTPSSLHEIQALMKHFHDERRKVRILGTGHSRSAIAHSEDLYISLNKYRGLVNIDKNKMVATFRGGTRLYEIIEELEKNGFSLSILPAIADQTISGALATATHGSGVHHGNLASYLTGLQMVTATGEVLSITPESDSDLFHAAGVSLGLLGIITEVTLKYESIFNLEESRVSYNLSYCIENMNELSKSAEHVKLWVELNSESCYVYSASKINSSIRNNVSDFICGSKMVIWEVFQWIFSFIPSLTSHGMKLLFSTDFFFSPYHRVVKNKDVYIDTHYMSPNKQAEISVPVENCQDAFRELIKVVNTFNVPLNHIVEVRFVKQDLFWMSNNYKVDSCHITKMFYNPSEYYWNTYKSEFYKATLKYRGRPHWGKSFNMTPGEVDELYPKFQEFLNIRKRLDPNGVFLNQLMKDTFGI